MAFEPMGGFPSFIPIEDAIPSEKGIESRGFASNNIVSIGNIMDKKKGDLFMVFGSPQDEENMSRINDEDNINPEDIFSNDDKEDYDLMYNKLKSLLPDNKFVRK